jgi:hypothetical protein
MFAKVILEKILNVKYLNKKQQDDWYEAEKDFQCFLPRETSNDVGAPLQQDIRRLCFKLGKASRLHLQPRREDIAGDAKIRTRRF